MLTLRGPAFFRPLEFQRDYCCRVHYGDSACGLEDTDTRLGYRFETISILGSGCLSWEGPGGAWLTMSLCLVFHQLVHSDVAGLACLLFFFLSFSLTCELCGGKRRLGAMTVVAMSLSMIGWLDRPQTCGQLVRPIKPPEG